MGSKGTLYADRGRYEIHPEPRGGIEAEQAILGKNIKGSDFDLDGTLRHIQNWLDCIVSRKDPICHAEVGHRSVSVCHLANISLRLGGRKMNWDSQAEQFIGDSDGNAMLHREPRDWENA